MKNKKEKKNTEKPTTIQFFRFIDIFKEDKTLYDYRKP